jgi:hypothetical protein
MCNPENMRVIELNPGTNSMPYQLPANTIYVLNSGTYINTGTRNLMGNCLAIIGKENPNIVTSININSTTDGNIYGN